MKKTFIIVFQKKKMLQKNFESLPFLFLGLIVVCSPSHSKFMLVIYLLYKSFYPTGVIVFFFFFTDLK